MRRRDFVAGLGAAAWPVVARAQQPAMPTVGFLGASTPQSSPHLLASFRKGLSEFGYIEGRNVAIEYRWAEGRYDRLPALAADLVQRPVAMIATPGSTPAALAAKAATTSIPIVFQIGADPVEVGLVASLSRPGGNVTGVTSLNVEVASKRVELLHELLPSATMIALLVNPANPAVADSLSRETEAAARFFGLQLHILHASTERDLENALASLIQLQAGALVVGTDQFLSSRSGKIGALALRYRVPAIYQYREFTAAGGLMSYGGNSAELYRLTGIYSGRILKGENPADLPVQQATKLELIINLKTARALGFTVPQTLLARADEVIE
jgi:putative ABC transport system substrate-binding protein